MVPNFLGHPVQFITKLLACDEVQEKKLGL